MKKIIILLLALGITGIAKAQFDAEHDPMLTRSLSSDQIKKVFINTSGGNISVIGINSSGDAKLEVYARPNQRGITRSKENIQKLLDENYELNISITDNELHANAKSKNNFFKSNNQLSISFKVFIPINAASDLSTSGGNISLFNLAGNQKFITSGGNLRIENLQGTIKGATSGGNINAKNSSGEISLSTSGGSLNLDGLKGNIKAATSGGNISGNNIEGNLATHTSGGNVSLQDMACTLDASTSGGNMSVSVKELDKYIKLNNSGGNIYLLIPDNIGLDLKLHASKIDVAKLNNFSGSKKEDNITGTLNGGGIPVSVAINSGKITLAFK